MTNNLSNEMAQLNSRLDELSLLNESEYETQKTVTLFQYFDRIYTLCHGTEQFQSLIETLNSKKYAKLCYPIFKRIHTDVFKTQERWYITYYLLHSLWNYTDKSDAICFALVESQYIPMLIFNLNHDTYLKNFSSNDTIKRLFEIIASILHNVAQVPELVNELRNSQCLPTLNRIISTAGSQHVFLKGISYLTQAYIIREDERSYLTSAAELIPYLVSLLAQSIDSVDRRSNGLEARELCRGLSKLSVANENKYKIYSEAKLLDSLLNMLEQQSNSQEQIAACTLIWNLSFDEKVRKVNAEHAKLNQILQTIAHSSSNDELRRSATGCLCTLMGGPIVTSKKNESSSPPSSDKRIMISYNHDAKQLSKQIKDHLAADGYRVWIDLENMHGNLLDSMADAIESSSIFLMCLTEKYKDSPSCRLECEYAYQRKKHMIPLLLQANYKPDGWLGIVVGSKLYVNYAKKPFQTAYQETIVELREAMSRLEKKSNFIATKKTVPSSEPRRTTSPGPTESTPIASPSSYALANLMSQLRMEKPSDTKTQPLVNWEKMSITDTQHLLAENGLEKFMPMFIEIDGPKLSKLFEIKKQAPSCYYTLIKDKWDQLNQTKEQNISSSTRTNSTSMANFLLLTIALDKLADRLSTNQ